MTNRSRRPFAAIVALTLVASACGSGTDSSDAEIRVLGGNMGSVQQTVVVSRDGQSVDDATVTVNGFSLGSTGSGRYTGQIIPAVPAGGQLNLVVEVGTTDITARGTVPPPASVQTLLPSVDAVVTEALQVRWQDLAPNPDYFILEANCSGCNTDLTFNRPGSESTFNIPPNTLEAGNSYLITVTAYNRGTFTGAVDDNSSMNIANSGPGQSVNIVP